MFMVSIKNIYKITLMHNALKSYKKDVVTLIEGVTDIFKISEANKQIKTCNSLMKTLEISIENYNKNTEISETK